jgi:glycosyltransferase involved in cell wall biosynthesis
MRIAFYAPMKSPDHPVPSGDRQLARSLTQALALAGHEVSIASRFRSLDAAGNPERQARVRILGSRLARRLIARYRRTMEPPELWFTYHLYHKAPDLLGLAVSRALDIPYVVAEASVAGKASRGRWAQGDADTVSAIAAADAVLIVNPVDIEGVRRVRGSVDADEVVAPFVDLAVFRPPAASARIDRRRPRDAVRLITVAMMRRKAKLASFRLLAAALRCIAVLPWELVIVGDGPARSDVEAAFAEFDSMRVRFVGERSASEVAALLREHDLFLWPAIDEAFGLAFIEAQACGLPVVGGLSAGVAAVVAANRTGLLVPGGDAEAFADAARRLITDPPLRHAMGQEAINYAQARHGLPAAARRIDALLARVAARRATSREARISSRP